MQLSAGIGKTGEVATLVRGSKFNRTRLMFFVSLIS